MKKIISLSIVLLLFFTTLSSQTYRLETGYSYMLRNGDHVSATPYHGIHLGVNAEFPLKYNFGVETGLKYRYQFGNKTQLFEQDSLKVGHSYNAHALEIPLHINYTFHINKDIKLFAYTGPDINIGLAQKDNITSETQYVQTGTYDVYKKELSRFTILYGLGGGVQWKQYRLKSGYDWGLNNISQNSGKPQKIHGWNVSFEYSLK